MQSPVQHAYFSVRENGNPSYMVIELAISVQFLCITH